MGVVFHPGKVFVLGGDLRQCLPVVPHGSPADVVSMWLNKVDFWDQVSILRLHTNMRVECFRNRGDEQLAAMLQGWTEYLLRVGDGAEPQYPPDHLPYTSGQRCHNRCVGFLFCCFLTKGRHLVLPKWLGGCSEEVFLPPSQWGSFPSTDPSLRRHVLYIIRVYLFCNNYYYYPIPGSSVCLWFFPHS